MSKIVNYNCDICGCPIQTKYRKIVGPEIKDGKNVELHSSHPSYIHLVIEQMNVDNNYPERQMDCDICDGCFDAMNDVFRERREKYGKSE